MKDSTTRELATLLLDAQGHERTGMYYALAGTIFYIGMIALFVTDRTLAGIIAFTALLLTLYLRHREVKRASYFKNRMRTLQREDEPDHVKEARDIIDRHQVETSLTISEMAIRIETERAD